MNYYSRYPAHYLAATLHLSMEQDGAYNRLMDWAYSNEAPIPDDKKYIIGRAQNSREKRAINDVLSEFFSLTELGWVQKRIEEEINKAAPKIEAARINGLKGGRPRKQKPSGFPENNPVGFQDETQQEPSAKAPQSPIPIQKQKLPTDNAHATLPPVENPPPAPTLAGHACLLMRQAGCVRTNPSHPDLLAALAEGVTPQALADTAAEGAGKGDPFTWAIKTARNRHAAGASAVTGESHGNHPGSGSGRRESTAERAARFAREGDERDAARAAACDSSHGDAQVLAAHGGDLRPPLDVDVWRAVR